MMESTTLPVLISSLAQQTPENTWFISTDTGKTLSFGELDRQCERLGRQFAALGLKPGDKVSVYMPNCEHTAVLLLGIMANGLVANPINLMCQPSQLRYILWHSDTRLIFATRELGAALAAVLPDIDRPIRIVWVDAQADCVPDFADHGDVADAQNIVAAPAVGGSDIPFDATPVAVRNDVQPDADALLMYTSGTTGVPKGVLLTHKNLLENARNITREHRLAENDRVLGSLPLYHINGLVVTVITPLVHGGSVAMQPRFSAVNFWQNASRYECTWINVVPTIISYLLNSESDRDGVDLSRLRFCRSASSALPPEHHRQFEGKFGIGVIETMGLTETAAPAFSNPYPPGDRKVGSVGKPSGMQARVIDVDEQTVPHGVHGEIVLSGQNVMRGYYKDPERTAEAFTRDGWLRTGDIGYRDAEGYFYITGRAKELIIKGGENIAPREIDEALIKHPSVLDAAAVGVPHPDYGQDVVVYLVLRENEVFDPEEMRRHCLAELGKYKSPGKYIVVDDLPRGPSGKVQRLKLLEL